MADSMSNQKPRPETIAAHAFRAIDQHTGAVVPPLYLATTYARDENYQTKVPEDYQRTGNPTLQQAEQTIAALERGIEAQLFASGMAGITTLFQTIPRGCHVVANQTMYYNTRTWLQRMQSRGEITLTLFDAANPASLRTCLTGVKADLVWIETPSNPTWDCVDITEAASLAHAAGAVLGVDATATGAVTTLPLTLGADFVFHSATKYLNGHSDVLAGVLVARESSKRWDEVKYIRTKSSAPLAPFECWLLMRGMRTLFVRYRQCSANAMAIARHFAKHPNIDKILYPGLESHPSHAVAKKQMTDGFGGMMSFLLKGDFKTAQKFCTLLGVLIPATSLGGVETLAEHRKTVEGPDSPVPDNLVRFSIGIEHVDDLIADIEQALARMTKA
jgi:cystathionine gamma-synthase